MKRKMILFMTAVIMACIGMPAFSAELKYTEDHVGSLYYEVPEECMDHVTEKDSGKGYQGDGYLMNVYYFDFDVTNVSESMQKMLVGVIEGAFEDQEKYQEYDSVYGTYQKGYLVNARYGIFDVSAAPCDTYTYIVWCGDGVGEILLTYIPGYGSSTNQDCKEIYEHIGDTIHSADWHAEPTGIELEEAMDLGSSSGSGSTSNRNYAYSDSTNQSYSGQSDNTSATSGEKNALVKAKSYLSFSAFSYDSLIDQLEYEGFSHSEAEYGADHCGADWNEQAIKKAQSYLKISSFSRSSLIDQLEYEGFTGEQAVYGADHCGNDWDGSQSGVSAGKTNALEKAKSYLNVSAFSYTGLIDQLEYEGFSHEEAVYGADNCGADWDEQAAKKAESYLSFMSFSRSELIKQLEYEGFTSLQAAYGADAVGY